MRKLFDERYEDPDALQEILTELLFRHRSGAMELRAEVAERLVELSEDSFRWPSTEASGGDGSLSGDDWPKRGLLAYLGYHVGQRGVHPGDRRGILDFVYSGRLPNVHGISYMEKWGDPGSVQRLRKLAESLAAFCRNNKRKDPQSLAVSEYESDLQYLKRRYYDGKYAFVWPETRLPDERGGQSA